VQVCDHAVIVRGDSSRTAALGPGIPAHSSGYIDAMLEAHLDGRGCGHAGHARPGKGELQVVEHQEHVARGDQRAGGQQLGQARQADQKLVENRGRSAIGQGAGHAREELARCGAVRKALRVAARVDDEGALAVARLGQPGQGRAARADAPAPRVGYNCEPRGGR